MARSIHPTYSENIKGLTKTEITEQVNDPFSDLALLAQKRSIKECLVKKPKGHK